VCYEDPQNENKNYGIQAANACAEKLNGHVFEEHDGAKMEVHKYLSKEQRERQQLFSKINSKQLLKRQNLYITNFPISWTEDSFHQLFAQVGQIDSIKLEKVNTFTPYAFVCFKTAEASNNARQ
jgi:RNA recognition motif-containing protein